MLNISNQPPPPAKNTPDQIFQLAYSHHQANRLAEAERLYRQLLAIAPNHADAWHLLGVLACQCEQNQQAIPFIEKAIALNPRQPVYHSNFGEALRKIGDLPRAEAEFRQALALDPEFPDAYTNWGRLLLNANRDLEAFDLFQTAVRHIPTFAMGHKHLGDCLIRLKKFPEAVEKYQLAARLAPTLADIHFNLALALASLGRMEDAATSYRTVLALTPNDIQAHLQLADALTNLNRHAESIATYQAILAIDAKNAEAYSGMAGNLRVLDRVDDAIAAYQKSLALRPDDVATKANLALCLRDHARFDESLALFREVLAKNPEASAVRSAMIFTMHVHPAIAQGQIDRELDIYNQLYVETKAAARLPHSNDRSAPAPLPGRRLKIGYVSADLRSHPVGRFMAPLLANHNRHNVEVFCYSSALAPDAFTATLQTKADHWRHVTAISDADLAALIRADQIDILIDLSMHTIGNRLTLFALKPAPVQITYLAYCSGTGVHTIDYRLTDPFVDPPSPPRLPLADGSTAAPPAFEKPLHLPESYWCYAPPEQAAEVAPLPALISETVTFGSFNHFTKVNDEVLALWAQLLKNIPTARLLLHVPLGSRQPHVRNFFAQQNVAESRITLLGRVSESAYFAQYSQIDIALDPFPFAGGTTTCDALWMGVPVITLIGDRTISRGGASILSNLGLTQFIAATPEEYLQKAAALAADLPALAHFRQTLRPLMQNSPLMNAPRFAQNIEAAYRQAWLAWCQK